MSKFRSFLLSTAAVLPLLPVCSNVFCTEQGFVKSGFDTAINLIGDFQLIGRRQGDLSVEEQNVSTHHSDFAFRNRGAVLLTAKGGSTDCMQYGVQLAVVVRQERASVGGSHIFFESKYGKIELGSPEVAGSKLSVGPLDVAAGAGGTSGAYLVQPVAMRQSDAIKGLAIAGTNGSNKYDGSQLDPFFFTYLGQYNDILFASSMTDKPYTTEPSRCISFYTPSITLGEGSEVKLGISYMPDSSNTGGASFSSVSSGQSIRKINLDSKESWNFDKTVKDVFSGGIQLSLNIDDGIDVKFSVTGEYGKSVGGVTIASSDNTIDKKKYALKDLMSYNIGGILNLGGFFFAGCYGSFGDSLTCEEFHKTGHEGSYYSGVGGYKIGPFAASLTLFKSSFYGNDVTTIAVGTDYKPAPGVKFYLDVSHATLKGKPELFPDLVAKETSGFVVISGIKLSLGT